MNHFDKFITVSIVSKNINYFKALPFNRMNRRINSMDHKKWAALFQWIDHKIRLSIEIFAEPAIDVNCKKKKHCSNQRFSIFSTNNNKFRTEWESILDLRHSAQSKRIIFIVHVPLDHSLNCLLGILAIWFIIYCRKMTFHQWWSVNHFSS